MKSKLSIAIGTILLTLNINNISLASEVTTYENQNCIPQRVVSERKIINKNGSIECEYVWEDTVTTNSKDKASNEEDQIGEADWVKHKLDAGTLKHRAAKISPNSGSSKWYGMSQTDYADWHYTRVRIVKTVTGKILQDSNQVQVNSGMATARTNTNKLYLLDWDFSLRSYWGT